MNAKEFEEQLISNQIVTKAMLHTLKYAYNYDAASTIDWAINRILTMKSIIDNGLAIMIEEDKNITLSSQKEFKKWVESKFPEISLKIFR